MQPTFPALTADGIGSRGEFHAAMHGRRLGRGHPRRAGVRDQRRPGGGCQRPHQGSRQVPVPRVRMLEHHPLLDLLAPSTPSAGRRASTPAPWQPGLPRPEEADPPFQVRQSGLRQRAQAFGQPARAPLLSSRLPAPLSASLAHRSARNSSLGATGAAVAVTPCRSARSIRNSAATVACA